MGRLRFPLHQRVVDPGGQVSPRIPPDPFGEPSLLREEEDARDVAVEAVAREGSNAKSARLEISLEHIFDRGALTPHPARRQDASILLHDEQVIILVKELHPGVDLSRSRSASALNPFALADWRRGVLDEVAIHRHTTLSNEAPQVLLRPSLENLLKGLDQRALGSNPVRHESPLEAVVTKSPC